MVNFFFYISGFTVLKNNVKIIMCKGECMSVIQALAAMQYTMMRNNAAISMINANNARIDMISGLNYNACSPSFKGLDTLTATDTQLEMQAITSGLQYKMSIAMLEQIKKQQKEDTKRFSIFA